VVYALRRLAVAVALAGAWVPILAFEWWSFAVTVPSLALASVIDPDDCGTELE
jgi:hypothetical protein